MNQVLSTPSLMASSGADGLDLNVARLIRPGYPEDAPVVLHLRRRLQRDRNAAAVDHDGQRMSAREADDALHVDEVVDLAAVDRGDQVSGLEAGGGGGAVGLDRGHPRDRDLLAENHENAGEKDDRENEIGQRAGHHDGRAAADRLAEEAMLALLLGHRRKDRASGTLASFSSPKNLT